MKLSSRNIQIAAWFAQAVAILYTSHYSLAWLASILLLGPLGAEWYRGGRTKDILLKQLPELVVGLSVIAFISLTGSTSNQQVFSPVSQMIIACGYFIFVLFRRYGILQINQPLLTAAIMQTTGTAALFLILTFWQWPESVILALLWVLSFGTAYWYLAQYDERASLILSMAWALIATQVSWVFTVWLVNYTVVGGAIVIPQAALVVLGLGYCVAGIYQSHNRKRLSQRRLIEYMIITGVLLAIIVAGTRWSGTS